MKPLITKMCEDSEFDVRYFAEETKDGIDIFEKFPNEVT